MGRLQDKVTIMTGAGGGICHKASEFFCKEGAKVVMVDIDPEVEAFCAEIVKNGGDAIAIVADVSKKETWDMLLKTTLEKYGRVDCVVNGAAIYSTCDWHAEWTEEVANEYASVLANNINSMVLSYNVVLKYMKENNIKGNFINFASSTALSYMGSGADAYPMSKVSIMRSTMNMVSDNSPYGIRFNCLAPNCVEVPKMGYLYAEEGEYSCAEWFRSIMPMGHWGEPEDAAWCMVYLASDEAKFVNGVCIPVDGGWSTCH